MRCTEAFAAGRLRRLLPHELPESIVQQSAWHAADTLPPARERAYLATVQVIEAVCWSPDGRSVRIIDQRLLPGEFVQRDLRSAEEIREAISTLAVRGAPAIGVTAAMGLASIACTIATYELSQFRSQIASWATAIRSARPTAVNLAWAVDRVVGAAWEHESVASALAAMREEAQTIRDEDRAMCRRIGEFGADLLRDGMGVLTHCNTGALATAGIGTALAALYVAHERGIRLRVFASETRPLLQGSRLTAWELSRAGLDVTIFAEGAAASLMRSGSVDCCIVGADRITRNGDVANKIGTYSHAALANCHGIPFYVAAPRTTIDATALTGGEVEIEQRQGSELLGAVRYEAEGALVRAYNPAFDITPAALVSAIITDKGVHYAPYDFA